VQPFPFTKVLDYRRHMRLECRQELAEVLSEEQKLQDHRTGLEVERQRQLEELGQLAESSNLSVDAASRRRCFAGQLDIQLLVVNEQLLLLQVESEKCRTALVQADQDVQTLERLEEMHVTRTGYESRRRSEIELADQWQAARLVIGHQ
jgi:flagellar export protein FliJ